MAEAALTGLSSMATRGLLAELAAVYDHPVAIEATGGVDAARRVRAGEAVDLVILADDVMCALAAEGHIRPGTITGIAVSSIAVAVRDGEPLPSLADGPALRQAVSAALRIGYSTGPSGDHVLHLLEAWNLRHELGDRLVRARPGIPVGQLLAQGDVDLAFQQSSELMGVPGIVIAGTLPPDVAKDTLFAAGIARSATSPDAARAFITYVTSAAATDAKRRHGMIPP